MLIIWEIKKIHFYAYNKKNIKNTIHKLYHNSRKFFLYIFLYIFDIHFTLVITFGCKKDIRYVNPNFTSYYSDIFRNRNRQCVQKS